MTLLTMVRSLRNDRLDSVHESLRDSLRDSLESLRDLDQVPKLTSRSSASAPTSPRSESPSEFSVEAKADIPPLLSRRTSSKLDKLVAGVPTLISRRSSNLLASFRSLRRGMSRTNASQPSSPRPESPIDDASGMQLFTDEEQAAAVTIQRCARRRRSGPSAHVLSLWPSLAALRGQYLDSSAIAAGARGSILYTDAMVVAREALRTHPQVESALDVAWAAVSQGATELREEGYFSMARRLYLVLQLMGEASDGAFSAQDCVETTRADWEEDRRGKDHLTKADFCRCWFQLADLHTEAVSASAYAWWISSMVERIARPKQGAAQGGWEWRDDRAIMAEACALPRVQRLTAAPRKRHRRGKAAAPGALVPRVRKLGVWERLLWNSTFLPAQRAEKRREEAGSFPDRLSLPPRRSSGGDPPKVSPRPASRGNFSVGPPTFGSAKRLLGAIEPTPPQKKAAMRSPAPAVARRGLRPLGHMAPAGPEHAQSAARQALRDLLHTPHQMGARSAADEARSRRLAPLAA